MSETRRPRPIRVEWELYDPMDGMMLIRVSEPYRNPGMHFRKIRRAPALAKIHVGLRPDGKPMGLRMPRTRTRLVYA